MHSIQHRRSGVARKVPEDFWNVKKGNTKLWQRSPGWSVKIRTEHWSLDFAIWRSLLSLTGVVLGER